MVHRINIAFVLPIMLIVITMLSAPACASTAEADSAKHHQKDTVVPIDDVIFKLKIALSLTDKQGEQIRPVLEEDMKERSEIMKDNKNDKDKLKSALEGLQQRTVRELSQYLTEDQMKKLEEMQKTQQDQAGQKKGAAGRKGMGERKMFGRGGS